MNIKRIAIDIAKQVFQIHNKWGRVLTYNICEKKEIGNLQESEFAEDIHCKGQRKALKQNIVWGQNNTKI